MRSELLKIWPSGVATILDLGCRDCWHTARLPGVTQHVGVEVWPPALERGMKKAMAGGIPHFKPVCAEALTYLKSRSDNIFDAVLAIDLLEHLVQPEALELLDEMARVASKLAAVWTTLGHIQQGPYDIDAQPNPFEEHKWGPTLDVFITRNWQVKSYPSQHGERGGAILAWLSK